MNTRKMVEDFFAGEGTILAIYETASTISAAVLYRDHLRYVYFFLVGSRWLPCLS